MQPLQCKNIILFFTCLIVGVLLTACELLETKPDIERVQKKSAKKVTKSDVTLPDIGKLSLKEIHDLPQNRDCKKLLSRAALELIKRSTVAVKVKPIKGMPGEPDLENIFYLEPEVDKYPQDDSIRTYECPRNLEDVKVTYNLKKGPGYKKTYHYSYHGDLKGIDTSSSSEPRGQIEARFGEGSPEITLQIDKIEILSLNPLHTFSNEDVSFRVNEIVFDGKNHVSFKFFNNREESLAIRKFEVILGPNVFQVDFKSNIVDLAQYQMQEMNEVKVVMNQNKWFVTDGNKPVRFMVRLLYKAGRQIKKLTVENYIRMKDLGINNQ